MRQVNDPIRWLVALLMTILWLIAMAAHGAELPATLPGGVHLLTAPASLGWIDGVEINYQGPMRWRKWAAVKPVPNGAALLRFTGDGAAIASGADGAVLDGVNVWRAEYSAARVEWPVGSIGFRFTGPASTSRVQNLSIAGFETGIHIPPSNHCEHFLFENLQSNANRYFFVSDEQQAVGHHFQNIFQSRECETLFWFRKVAGRTAGGGGNISGDTIVVQHPCLFADIDQTSKNSCWFVFTNVKIDGGAIMRNWRLLRHRAGPIHFVVRGLIGDDVEPAADAIVTADPDGVDVKLWWRGKIWPRDFHVVSGKWQAVAGPAVSNVEPEAN